VSAALSHPEMKNVSAALIKFQGSSMNHDAMMLLILLLISGVAGGLFGIIVVSIFHFMLWLKEKKRVIQKMKTCHHQCH